MVFYLAESSFFFFGQGFIQALRAFRRAEIIFDVVFFERCAGGVAVAMTFTSIFDLDFWFLWCRFGCFFWCLLEAFVSPESVSGTSFGGHFGSLGSLLGAFGGLFGC